MKVITGGLGFIGSNLANKLLKLGHTVYLVDDLSTGRYENLTWLYRNNLKSVQEERIHFIQADIVEKLKDNSLTDCFVGVDQIYHLACPASPPKYWKNPLKTLDINYVGTKNILELAKKHKSRILFTSTSEIYGDPLVHPQPETYNGNVDPISPRSVYDEGKRVAETLVSEYHRTYGLETKIARIFNTYGPRMDPDDGRVVTNFIKQILTNNPITIYGTGNQTRSFCYVDDQVSGLIKLMNCDEFINEPVNIGNDSEITIIELVHKIRGILGPWGHQPNAPPFDMKELPPSDPKRRKADLSKMKSIGWEPKIKLEDGLKETIKYMKDELAIKDMKELKYNE